MERLPPVKLAEHLQHARYLASCTRLRPLFLAAKQKGAEVAVTRILEGEAVDHFIVGADQREDVEHADGAGVILEELTEVRLPQPGVDVYAGLDADGLRDVHRPADSRRQEYLSEATLAEQPLDPVRQS